MSTPTKEIAVKSIPADLHRAFHAICVSQGKTMRGAIIAYMEAVVETHELNYREKPNEEG